MRLAIFAALALLLLGGLWVALRPPPSPAVAPVVVEAEAGVAAARAVPAMQRFELSVPLADGIPRATWRVQAGDPVKIVVTSAHDDELHLHGYDLSTQLRAGEPGTLSFVAEHAGRFDLELHRGHAEIAVLEVAPR